MTLDLRPVAYVTGLLLMCLGGTMLFPIAADVFYGNDDWIVFFEAMLVTFLFGLLMTLASARGATRGLDVRQTFVLTVFIWLILPVFGALPFMVGVPSLSFTDAFFEAMSGLTTTGATVMSGLGDMPQGILLWRAILQWLGGVGIVVVAMVFLPELRVGGMQIFRSESFETMGKILPRAAQMASQISIVYIGLTVACGFSYLASGMGGFDSLVHALTTLSTGGMANTDSSFGAYSPLAQYICSGFMVLAALPFVRYVQVLAGSYRPLLRDSQVRVFLMTFSVIVLGMTLYTMIYTGDASEKSFRETLFHVASIMTGTGFAVSDYTLLGPFAMMGYFFIALIGGCAGSTACSVKVFRYQLLFTSIRTQIRKLNAPHGVFVPRYEGKPVSRDVLNSVMAFFLVFPIVFGVVSVALSLTGLDFITSVSGAATAIANVGPGLGPEIGPAGNFANLNDAAKWILALTMIVGRLEILTVLTLFSVAFWRD